MGLGQRRFRDPLQFMGRVAFKLFNFFVRQQSLSVLFDFFFRGFTVLYDALVDNERRKAESHGRDEKNKKPRV
jgi:hypothetical protein